LRQCAHVRCQRRARRNRFGVHTFCALLCSFWTSLFPFSMLAHVVSRALFFLLQKA
jgi:hypothetical protein